METEFYLLDVDYIDAERNLNGEKKSVADIRLFGKTEKGKAVLAVDRNFRPYFYAVPRNGIEDVKEKIEDVEDDEVEIAGVEVVEKFLGKEGEKVEALKIYSYHPSDLKEIRDKVKRMNEVGKGRCYDFSMNFYRKYLIDRNIKPFESVKISGEKAESDRLDLKIDVESIEPGGEKCEGMEVMDSLAFDIEVYKKLGERKIIMLSMVSDSWKKVLTYEEGDYGEEVEVLDSEKELIQRFVEIVDKRNPDFIITYNGDDYDFSTLRERAEENDIELTLGRDGSRMLFERRARTSSARIPGRVHIDLYRFVDQILSRHLETEVLTLNEVAGEMLGEGKVEMELEEILEIWREKKSLSKLAKYCLRDSEITMELARQLLPQISEISRIVGQMPFDCSRMTYGQLVEWFLLHRSSPERIPPQRPKWEEIQKRRKMSPYEGGFVKEPVPGIHESITVLDFQSLYPTIIVSYNISPDTMGCDNCENCRSAPGKEVSFRQDKKGFIPSLLEELIVEREEVKVEMEREDPGSVKYRNLNNRQYALKVLANSVYGYYGYVGARWFSRECAESITALGRKWIKEVMEMAEEGGLEVIYGDTDSLMIKNGDTGAFLDKVNGRLPGIMRLDLEGKFSRGIFVSKEKGRGAKKRYALADEEGKLKIRGFETVRRDWCALAKRVQRRILEKILLENSKEGAIKYTKKIVGDIQNRNVDLKDLIIYTQLTKPIDEYESTGPHVEAAKKMKDLGEAVGPGSVIMYVITEGSGSISERAKPFEHASIDEIDSGYYVENQIIPAALRVLKVLGVDKKQLLGKGSQRSLGSFQGEG